MIKKLLSLPANLVGSFHNIEHADPNEWFCTSDPSGTKVGSGGGTAWLLEQSYRHDTDSSAIAPESREVPNRQVIPWLAANKRIILHAGGQSRRLPAYAPSGKILTPIPVFRWARGQRIDQNLLELQLPLLEQMISEAPRNINTLIASGDVYIRSTQPLAPIPDVDIVCYGLWGDPSLATNHGVFISDRNSPNTLKYMLQKPSVTVLDELIESHLFLMDIGIWLLSDRAVELLIRKSHNRPDGEIGYYDLYSDFGLALGEEPSRPDPEIGSLSVAILPLEGGEFYHYGTSRELISSTLALQNLIADQREIKQRKVKPHPAIFTQNADVDLTFTSGNAQVWIENSCIGNGWHLSDHHILTGIPENNWQIDIPAGVCVDIVPVGERQYAVRPYGFNDPFKGDVRAEETVWMGNKLTDWCKERNLAFSACGETGTDLQNAPLFPLCDSAREIETVLRFMIGEPGEGSGRQLWLEREKLSADEISNRANLVRLYAQRDYFRSRNLPMLAANYRKSVFYQLNLDDAARQYATHGLPLPVELSEQESPLVRMHDLMFRSKAIQQEQPGQADAYERQAFGLLSETIIRTTAGRKREPRLTIHPDQIVWSRCPVRIDLAGGWTDTPPQCFLEGGHVVNIAIELNGQPPIQIYIKPCREFHIVFRSIDLGDAERVRTWEELQQFTTVGSPFSIPKAAVALAGFLPRFCSRSYSSLEAQLKEFGSGFEVTLLSAIPAGSGLGTSSILAATVLGALNDFCGLAWDKNDICQQSLILEQLLTTGGGWQDQYGGVFHGVKLLQTVPGTGQTPAIRWTPNFLFSDPAHKECHLLYYTGITRVAKNILADIVRNMFLNTTEQLDLLYAMKQHALETFDAIQAGDFDRLGHLVGKTWEQNKRLDAGTNPPQVDAIIDRIKDYILGCKLPGAGGGGYLYMIAKDPGAARRIREILTRNPPNDKARFVEMVISPTGLQTSRS